MELFLRSSALASNLRNKKAGPFGATAVQERAKMTVNGQIMMFMAFCDESCSGLLCSLLALSSLSLFARCGCFVCWWGVRGRGVLLSLGCASRSRMPR